MDDDLPPWRLLGEQLGLTAAVVSEGSMLGWTFASFRREIAEPETRDPKLNPWLYGMWQGVAVVVRLVRRVTPPPERDLVFGWHSPADFFELPRVSHYRMAMAEISPALFAGVRMASSSIGSLRFPPPHPTPLIQLEPARLDRAFSTFAGNAPRLRKVFERRGPGDDFPERLAEAAERVPIAIQDGVVEVFLPGKLFDAKVVGGELDAAVAIAKKLSKRAAELPEEANVAATRSGWAEVAASRGLQFDALRWHAFGRIAGARIEVVLEPTVTFVRTTVRAVFPTPLNAAPSRETFDAVREQVAKAEKMTAHVFVNTAEVLLAQERCVVAKELATLIDQAVAIVAAATPPAVAAPYR